MNSSKRAVEGETVKGSYRLECLEWSREREHGNIKHVHAFVDLGADANRRGLPKQNISYPLVENPKKQNNIIRPCWEQNHR